IHFSAVGPAATRTGDRPIAAGFSEAERQRFHNLLQLAAESPFEGERANALAAATRLATRCGLTLDEAAAGGSRQEPRREPERSDDFMADDLGFRSHGLDRFARAVHLMDNFILSDKARRAEALREAQARGLDADELRKAVTASVTQSRMKRRRMNPDRHAATLLRETSLSFREIATITGLDIYSVVGLKLKLRASS
ncbi:MAG TPA: DUF2786 domain-containing protein, partial [Kiloniellaceae bacterium]|nr:DUF2786 domain-containing protein [Kiloniellaceae bacterium]